MLFVGIADELLIDLYCNEIMIFVRPVNSNESALTIDSTNVPNLGLIEIVNPNPRMVMPSAKISLQLNILLDSK